MKNKAITHKSRKRINHYSAWKYVVLVATVIILTLSAIPTWFGEKPAIQIQVPEKTIFTTSVQTLKRSLEDQGIPVLSATEQDNQISLLFDNESDQTHARTILNKQYSEESIAYSYQSVAPQWLSNMGMNPIKLGLDLRGGVQFLLHVDVDKAMQEQQSTMVEDIKAHLRQNSIRNVQVRVSSADAINVNVRDSKAQQQLMEYVRTHFPNWQISASSSGFSLAQNEQSRTELQSTIVQQNLQIMRGRIEELGITEAMVQRQGTDNIRIELPGVQDPAQAKNVIGATASLAFYEVKSGSSAYSRQNLVLKDNDGRSVVLEKRPVLAGEHITNARSGMDEMGLSEVNITLDHAGGKKMSDFSATHIGKPMATVYREYQTNEQGVTERSERVISVATIQSQLGSQFRITGSGSMQEAQELAMLLRAGSLTAPVTIVEERTIGASLGAENIQNGFAALAFGMGMTLLFMAVWYRRLGWVANVALCTNMLCLLGLIALLPGAVLTLPGIAGLVLTVGMAVDTNVIIFERIKDKMREGRSFAQSIDAGFDSALSTILDANVTTMITAVILYSIGNGPIQGFALTLGLGLLTSIFTGVFASRAMINLIWGQDARREVRV
ncbi:protein-export membrane protein SecD [Vibrio breoganii]|uniref:protein translocase subunit SecD n=1 Tax=Vibrio breoganii TaxID=553239 RepID=UPI000C83B71F|nr:protein translocase subunit SecD [Vibrio breoganii]PMG37319.1 protein-export membrane protein SecD [Vibrio breoganii]PMK27706.1 protein-export membrane protein SecD [Vibrio breoganii]PML14298.1 protein-export membrane protein SecD [Vibrio breoganii]PML90450.1 protein-export membrane protein SecD [Vibrio breoganii]PMO66317.1 protein-export membrane protein SecD [Vibrio breoganii]